MNGKQRRNNAAKGVKLVSLRQIFITHTIKDALKKWDQIKLISSLLEAEIFSLGPVPPLRVN